MADETKKTPMTVAEAGRKGGEKVASERGSEFYSSIGKKGGETVARQRGHGFYEEIGRKGGQRVKAERGAAFYSQIGHKGGQKVKELIAQAKRRQAGQTEEAPAQAPTEDTGTPRGEE